ncbi:MAG: autotransporter outer membrane beta-barrel domain-containing protein [Verrucomicrobiales bacterium]|jgi:outer membrane autotransporter protein|nr:autotransporter outer membrane beta-barrel domain-containing protein [Verrucomicrobiales bacterium]
MEADGGALTIGDHLTGTASSYGLYLSGRNTLIIGDRARILAASDGLYARYGGHIEAGAGLYVEVADGVAARAQGNLDTGVSSTAIVHDATLIAHGTGLKSGGLSAITGGLVIADRVDITATSGYGARIESSGTILITDSRITSDKAVHVNEAIGADADAAAVIIVKNSDLAAVSDVVFVESAYGPGIDANARVEIIGGTASGGGNLINNNSLSGTYNIVLDNVATSDAGGITVSDHNNGDTIVNVSGGSGINGDVTNSGSGVLTVNLDHSAMRGDANNLGDGTLTVTLDHNSIGTGGFNGGNLIVGGDSEWTFDKDSHGNYGENNGTWNIGDYDVTFDHLTNNGTINLSVNSDTGAGGSIDVDTADGDGTIHIDTTGNGQADPNQILPDIVSGEGTENWQWDPIDWGIDTIIKDGDHFIKNGTSPAGAVLNSAIAAQQSLWFAQQNSLLKRMGELRYGARASRPPAGGTPAFHNLIDNLWLRSYGQQLNIGSKVSGKAYEQLIYGVDLGTDHKFTISADNDLYLGVYAGYGRSDIDYRTPGTDGEINSYYGGLYATWLHSSGFYIDATFKAASVDNDLKAPYSGSQITANYSDVNIGSSLELGKKFTFSDGWFIEPQFQVNYLHILAENYTAGPLTISAQDLDALQLRIGSVFGRIINLTNSGALQPYVKISGVETISSGGAIRNGYQHTRANTDGARAEVGGGIIWQLDADNQLHLDYEASFGDKYDKPWGLTAGYRHQF